MHPLPPPDSGASFSSFGVFVFEIWVLSFRSRVLCFRVLGASCFGLRFRVLRFRTTGFTLGCSFFNLTSEDGLFVNLQSKRKVKLT